MRLVEKGGLLRSGALPVADILDRPPVRQGEPRDVHRIAEGVLGQPRSRLVVDRTARIGAEHVDGRDLLAKARLGVRLHDVAKPRLERRDHRAVDGQRLVDADLAVVERGDLERPRHPADARPVDFMPRGDAVRKLDEVAGEAGVFRLGSPCRPFRTADESAARQAQGRERHDNPWPNTTRHGGTLRHSFKNC